MAMRVIVRTLLMRSLSLFSQYDEETELYGYKEPAPRPQDDKIELCQHGRWTGDYCEKCAASSPVARPLYWTATDWYPLIQKANDAVFALEVKASPDAKDVLRRQFFQARVAIGTAENIVKERFKREGIE